MTTRFLKFAVVAAQLLAASATAAASLSSGVGPWLVNGNPAVALSPIAIPFWVNNFGDGVWIGATADDGNVGIGANAGSYVFTLSLGSLAGAAGNFSLQYAADNSVSWSISNGTLGGNADCSSADCFTVGNGAPRALTGSFASNSVLTATVVNTASSTPTGLLAVGTFTPSSGTPGPGAGPVPEPDAWFMMLAGFVFTGAAMRFRRREHAMIVA